MGRGAHRPPADVVLVAPCGYHLEQATGFAEQLVADDRLPGGAEVWAVDADSHFVRPGPRLVDGAETVAQILHPGLVGAPPADACDAHRVDPGADGAARSRDVKQVTYVPRDQPRCAARPDAAAGSHRVAWRVCHP